jgi:hypothetical protein
MPTQITAATASAISVSQIASMRSPDMAAPARRRRRSPSRLFGDNGRSWYAVGRVRGRCPLSGNGSVIVPDDAYF